MKILCCGDSHAKVFKFCNEKQYDIIFDVCIVSGATAQGAVNPNSKTDALNLFEKKTYHHLRSKDIKIKIPMK